MTITERTRTCPPVFRNLDNKVSGFHRRPECNGTRKNAETLEAHLQNRSRQEASAATDDSWQGLPILNPAVPPIPAPSRAAPSPYTHVRIPVRGFPNGKTLVAVGDTGASRCVISEQALQEYFPDAVVNRDVTSSIIGIGKQTSNG